MQHGIPVLSTQALYPIPCLLGFLPIDCDQCEIIEEIYQENIRAGDRDALQFARNETVHVPTALSADTGSRAVIVLCRDEEAARKHFGIRGEGIGVIY